MSYTALSLTQSTERGSKGIEMNCFAFADAGGVEAGEALITSSDATNETALTGTMGIAVTGVVTGSGTAFDTELSLGDVIKVGSTYHKVISETSATVIGRSSYCYLDFYRYCRFFCSRCSQNRRTYR